MSVCTNCGCEIPDRVPAYGVPVREVVNPPPGTSPGYVVLCKPCYLKAIEPMHGNGSEREK